MFTLQALMPNLDFLLHLDFWNRCSHFLTTITIVSCFTSCLHQNKREGPKHYGSLKMCEQVLKWAKLKKKEIQILYFVFLWCFENRLSLPDAYVSGRVKCRVSNVEWCQSCQIHLGYSHCSNILKNLIWKYQVWVKSDLVTLHVV